MTTRKYSLLEVVDMIDVFNKKKKAKEPYNYTDITNVSDYVLNRVEDVFALHVEWLNKITCGIMSKEECEKDIRSVYRKMLGDEIPAERLGEDSYLFSHLVISCTNGVQHDADKMSIVYECSGEMCGYPCYVSVPTEFLYDDVHEAALKVMEREEMNLIPELAELRMRHANEAVEGMTKEFVKRREIFGHLKNGFNRSLLIDKFKENADDAVDKAFLFKKIPE